MLALTDDALRSATPSVFAASPWEGVNPSSYRFVPTAEVLGMMADHGFQVVKAAQSKSRIPGKAPFTRHMLRLRHADHMADTSPETAEIVLVNSHDRTSAYKLFAGIFRLVCSNGMIVQSHDFGSFSIRHSGHRDLFAQISEATDRIMDGIPSVMNRIDQWKEIVLPRPAQIDFARQAWELKPHNDIPPAFLLTARRQEDATNPDFSRDLWRTLQVVQENLMRGGLSSVNARGRRVSTRPIKAVEADIRINRSLWEMTQRISLN